MISLALGEEASPCPTPDLPIDVTASGQGQYPNTGDTNIYLGYYSMRSFRSSSVERLQEHLQTARTHTKLSIHHYHLISNAHPFADLNSGD